MTLNTKQIWFVNLVGLTDFKVGLLRHLARGKKNTQQKYCPICLKSWITKGQGDQKSWHFYIQHWPNVLLAFFSIGVSVIWKHTNRKKEFPRFLSTAYIYKKIHKIMFDSISQVTAKFVTYVSTCTAFCQQTVQSKNNRTAPPTKKNRGKRSKSCHLFQRSMMAHRPNKIQEPWVLLPAMQWNVLQETGNCTCSPSTRTLP